MLTFYMYIVVTLSLFKHQILWLIKLTERFINGSSDLFYEGDVLHCLFVNVGIHQECQYLRGLLFVLRS